MNKKVRVGIVGLGDHCSKSHVEYLLNMKGLCNIVALCDLDHEKAKDIQYKMDTVSANDVYYYSKYEDMLRNDNIDAVFIMTPDHLHTSQLVAAVEAGKHVFCEKPLASTEDEYQQLIQAFAIAQGKNLIVTTCHPRRYDTPFEALKAMVQWESGSATMKHSEYMLGTIHHFDFNFQYHAPSKHGLHTSLMFDHLNHELDCMHFLFGKCSVKHAVKNFDYETQFHVSGRRDDGITFSFFGQRQLHEKIYPEYLRILCEKGFVSMDLYTGKMTIVYGDGSEITYHNPSLYKTDYTKRFQAINKNFLESILGVSENYLTAKEMQMNTKLAIDLHANTFVEYGYSKEIPDTCRFTGGFFYNKEMYLYGKNTGITYTITMKYGVVLGKHLDISRAELFAQGIELEKHYGQVALFSDTKHVDFAQLAGIVKRGQVIKTESIQTTDLLGVSDRELGTFLKKRGVCRRYKDFEPMHTDEEVKNKGKEYIVLDKDFEHILEVTGYQDISRFSCIDFDKPVNSMQIGMMPAKLTQIMVNIASGKLQGQNNEMTKGPLTIYDPFMGLGTTYMIANSMGYNVIGSDINITPAKQNLPRWEKQAYYQKLPLTLFAHDATQSLSKPFLKYVNCIVTEGRLGHIITAKTKPHEITEYASEIEKLYKAWINNMHPLWEHMIIVCSIPWHTGGENKHVTNILQHCESRGISVETVPQVYTRSGQKVGRKIVTLKW